MKKSINYVLVIFLLIFSIQVFSFAKEKKHIKSYACRIETLSGKIYETLFSGFDWKTVEPNKKVFKTNNDNIIIKDLFITSNFIEFTVKSEKPGKLNLLLTDLFGNTVHTLKIDICKGFFSYKKYFNKLRGDMYILMFFSEGENIKTYKFSL